MAAVTAPAVFNVDVSPPAAAPEFTVEENSSSFELSGDMAGKENVKLGLTQDRILTIVGEQTKRVETTTEGGEQKVEEQKVPYQRAVPLPVTVDETAISAKMTQEGQLQLCMPKRDVKTAPNTAVGAC
mmetsp:Transcript_19436/g.49008  ORF Transcript_19436/g.49008 Transcript_19436/m.49008 type:complete len:128 (-) Transcript_19436:170-553(-)|eukprot:jgi/Tetstr1/454605/TSEL_041498.t1